MNVVVSPFEKMMSLDARVLSSLELDTEAFDLLMDFNFEGVRGQIESTDHS